MKGLRITFRALTDCRLLTMLVAMIMVPVQVQAQAPPVVRFQIERSVVEGESPLSEERTRAALAPFTGEHARVDGLPTAADALERAIQDAGVAFQSTTSAARSRDTTCASTWTPAGCSTCST